MAYRKLYIKPNKAAQRAAKRGLEARARAPKSKKGGLTALQAAMEGVGSGVLRARDIVSGKKVNAYQVNAFFNRHRNNYINAKLNGLKPDESRAIQSWLLWGGEPLRKQAASAVRKDKARRNPEEAESDMLFPSAALEDGMITPMANYLAYQRVRMTKVRFELPEGSEVAAEAMWVDIVQGDEDDGIGVLDNEPLFFSEAKLGDLVQYAGGSESSLPLFVATLECAPRSRTLEIPEVSEAGRAWLESQSARLDEVEDGE